LSEYSPVLSDNTAWESEEKALNLDFEASASVVLSCGMMKSKPLSEYSSNIGKYAFHFSDISI